MARSYYQDQEGRDYRYVSGIDESPRRMIRGYSQENQGGVASARERAKRRVEESRRKREMAVKRSFGGLDEYESMQKRQPTAQPMQESKPLPPTIARPKEAKAGPMGEKVIESAKESYGSTLQKMLERARKAYR